MVRLIVQKISYTKKRNSSCMYCVVITDFEIREMICSDCGVILQDTIAFYD